MGESRRMRQIYESQESLFISSNQAHSNFEGKINQQFKRAQNVKLKIHFATIVFHGRK